jgi:hypothetical protein
MQMDSEGEPCTPGQRVHNVNLIYIDSKYRIVCQHSAQKKL